jgi:single-strand DNA-binding protein
MQQLTLAGTVGRDAELRQTQNGDSVLSFPLAIDNGKDRDGNKRDATWFDCSVWGKRANSLQAHIRKGDKLAVTGRPGAREYNGKVYLQCSVNELTFMLGGQRRADSQRDSGGYDRQDSNGFGSGGRPGGDFDDEIPFAMEARA